MEPAKTSQSELKNELKDERKEVRKLTQEEKRLARREITKQVVTVISTALALVAGLFWQTAINDTIKTFIPVSGAWSYELGVALIFTIIAAVTIYTLSNSFQVKK